VFNSADDSPVIRLTDTKALVCYKDGGNSLYGTAQVLTVSGTTITGGAKHVFNNAYTLSPSVAGLTDTTAIVTYRDGVDTYGKACVLTISGTTVTSGAKHVFNNADNYVFSISASRLTDTKAIVTYTEGNNAYGTACVLTVSGTTVTSGAELVFNPGNTSLNSIAGLTDTTAIVCYKDTTPGTACVLTATNNYTLTFAAQASNPTAAWKPQAIGSTNTKLTPSSITYNTTTQKVKVNFPIQSFTLIPKAIRQLKYYMSYKYLGDKWTKLYSNLWKS